VDGCVWGRAFFPSKPNAARHLFSGDGNSDFAPPWEAHVCAPISRRLGKGMSVLPFRAALGRACLCSHFAPPWEGHVFAPISRHLGKGMSLLRFRVTLGKGMSLLPFRAALGKGMSVLPFRAALGRACLCSDFASPWGGHVCAPISRRLGKGTSSLVP
jgi:hypothetical protein